MSDSNWKSFVIIFHCICWFSTIVFVSYWFYKFALDEDLCVVDYKPFYESKADVFVFLRKELKLKMPLGLTPVTNKKLSFSKIFFENSRIRNCNQPTF